ncbi:hypothetical protein M426DRAFT_70709 [Hypoxylon sp. CI-4A]|nr:hypothetical protein M426DRAFT_70709 [Hypoxylon sp. CI-4A]
MRIAITGARGTVGREVVKLCSQKGHATVQINRTEQEPDETPNSEMRTADASSDYDATLKAFEGCDAVIHLAAIPDPVGQPDHVVHNNNVNSAFNGLRAAAELGIRRFCYASSVNAIGLAYANQPLKFPYFPIDEEAYPTNPTDAYALAKNEAEVAAKSFARWFPFMRIACLRIHEVANRTPVQKEHAENWQEAGVKQLWGWVSPVATARACLLAVAGDGKNGFQEGSSEIFNIVAPNTAQETHSAELAKKYYPNTELRGDEQNWNTNRSFWNTEKAQKMLGWTHPEKE